MRLSLGYPSRQAEQCLLQQSSRQILMTQLQAVFQPQEIIALKACVEQVYLSQPMIDYLLDLAMVTRKNRQGLSTRGLLALKKAAQAYALISQRDFVSADDIQAVFSAVVAHRLSLTESQAQGLLRQVKVS
jgi:MoxR-like ATPase